MYVPPAMMTEPTAEEQAEIDRINRIKDRRHQQYLRRKESGWQRKYEERVKNEKSEVKEHARKSVRALLEANRKLVEEQRAKVAETPAHKKARGEELG